MLKGALIAAALAAASSAHAASAGPATLTATAAGPGAMASPAARPAPSASSASSASSAADWTLLLPSREAGLDLNDVAAEPGSASPSRPGADARHRVLPALLALGALVVLLRKRPT
jgi:hypothetical protein